MLLMDGIASNESWHSSIDARNLEGNKLIGNIPIWASLKKLETLNLQHNNLSGTIPDFLGDLPALSELSLQYNNFIGEIPANIQAKVSNSQLKLYVDGNPSLCGNRCTTSKNNVATIVGITGATLFIFLLIYLLYRFVYRRPARIPGPIQSNDGNHNNRAPEERKGMLFSYEDIISATQNFRNVIGKGGFGMVFYGTWNEAPVAVKVLSQNSEQGRREFLNEVEILSTVHHRNLVTLVGYCQSPKLVLVYEYLSGGSLRDHINESTLHSLPWRTRLHIALDAAQALEYLHASCEPRIIHGDVKSSNILLNDNMQAKFGDFGLSRIHKDDTNDVATFNLRGTRGYVDPVYSSTMTLNEKSDVYSFGVILLEMISGRAPFDLRHPEVERNLVDWAHIHFQEGVELETMMDGRIRENNYNISTVWKIMELAMGCVKYIRLERPDMGGVVIGLKQALSIEEGGGMEIGCLDKSLVGDLKLNEVRAR